MKFLLVLGLFFSVHGWASEEEVKAHESKLASAKKWSHIEENLKSWIPGSVVKEFATAVHEKPYPKIRKMKYGLLLVQEDGLRVTIQLKSNGRISFNGKDWRFKPLLPIDQQVSQLALFLSGDQKKAGLGFFPSANASGDVDDDAYGSAAFAFAAANAWKADACDEMNLTDELVEDCTLMAVAMRFEMDGWKKKAQRMGLFGDIRRASVDTGKDKGGFYPIGLKCPKENGGKLQFFAKTEDGLHVRYTMYFKGNAPTYVSIDESRGNEAFRMVGEFELTSPDGLELVKQKKGVAKKGLLLNEEICNGPKAAKDKYFAALKSNAQMLKKYTESEDSEEDGDKKSMEST